ncbi:MAG: hypothetical protein RR902_04800 [Oscillospiraceae bacterium]
MNKIKNKKLIIVGILGLICVALVLIISQFSNNYVIKVNGNPVYSEEFEMLAESNKMLYEENIRQKNNIPDEMTVANFYEGDMGKLQNQMFAENVRQITQYRIEQVMAKNENVINTDFTYERFLNGLKAENDARAEKLAKGEVVYGVQSFSKEMYYGYFMSNLKQGLIKTLSDESLGITDEGVISYYENLGEYSGVSGEKMKYVMYDVTSAQDLPLADLEKLYEDISAQLAGRNYNSVVANGITYTAENKSFSPTELRDFVKAGYDCEFILEMALGEVSEPFSSGGKDYIAQYDGFEKTDDLQEKDKDVLRQQLKENAYMEMLNQKTDEAKIKINKTYAKKYQAN